MVQAGNVIENTLLYNVNLNKRDIAFNKLQDTNLDYWRVSMPGLDEFTDFEDEKKSKNSIP